MLFYLFLYTLFSLISFPSNKLSAVELNDHCQYCTHHLTGGKQASKLDQSLEGGEQLLISLTLACCCTHRIPLALFSSKTSPAPEYRPAFLKNTT